MFTLALLIGIYSYIIFSLGLLGFLYKPIIALTSLAYLFVAMLFVKKSLRNYGIKNRAVYFIKKSTKAELIFLILIFLQIVINLIGVLGPELGFDALWYHLTLPKIYLENHQISYVPGGLFYYSTMPKLTEMFYVTAISLGSEIVAKFIHFSFGVLCLVALYNLSCKFLSKTFSLLVLVLFYSNLVVGWMSITSYIDLARTFFEIMALWSFVNFLENKRKNSLVLSGVMLGLAISTKLLAVSSLFIFTFLMFVIIFKKYEFKWRVIKTNILGYWFFSLLIPLPWFVFSFVHTGNPLYPFFTNIYPVKLNLNLINPMNLSDPISPLYIVFLPIALFFYRKFNPALKLVSLYSFLAIVVWYVTSQTGGGRFILPYLPAFSIVSIAIVQMFKKTIIRNIFIGLIIFLSLFSIVYRGVANAKYLPVIFGKESKSQFLTNNLNFSFGDFYDTDEYLAKNIKKDDMVLLYGFHNLYYVNFSSIDSSYVKKGQMFNYIAVQGNNMPERFKYWNLVYYNRTTNIKLYSMGGLKWVY